MVTDSIRVSLNGEIREVAAGQNMAALLENLGVPADRVAIELNKTILRKRDWESTRVADGAQIEIVEFVGGG